MNPTAASAEIAIDELRDRSVRRVLWIEGGANLVALAVKLAVGTMTGSLAILADAVHSVSDLANNAIALIVMHFAAQPPDREHPYGHRKFETLAAFVLATLLTVLAIEIALHAARAPTRAVEHSTPGLVAMLGVLALLATVSVWQSRKAKELRSELLAADAWHTLSDTAINLTIIVGWQFSAAGHAWVDTALTLIVAAIILFFAAKLFRKVIPVLVDERAHDPDTLRSVAAGVDGVIEVRTVRSRHVGADSSIDVTITVDPGLRMTEGHDIAHAVEDALALQFPARFVNVHVEPAGAHVD